LISDDIVVHYRDIRISKAKTLMSCCDSCMILVQRRDIRISKFSLGCQRFCRCRARYAIPGATGRISHVPAPPTSQAAVAPQCQSVVAGPAGSAPGLANTLASLAESKQNADDKLKVCLIDIMWIITRSLLLVLR
jgi:hypothetical protein